MRQRDTLIEIVNIAFGRAAGSLSELTSERVLLEVPQVAVRPIDELLENLTGLVHSSVAAVHQEVLGGLPGDALLVQTETSAAILSEILTGSVGQGPGISSADREVLNEIGNILLHACVGTMGDTLGISIKLKPPQVYVEDLQEVLDRLLQKRSEIQWGLVITTRFRLGRLSEGPPLRGAAGGVTEGPPLRGAAGGVTDTEVGGTEVSGYIMLLLSVASLDKLLEALSEIG